MNESLPRYCSVHIEGTSYLIADGEIAMLRYGASELVSCRPDHIAPNGVPIGQIAYALAIIEGTISLGQPQFDSATLVIGAN